MKFYLGVHEPAWLARTEVPLFISRRRLIRRANLPEARGPWALDSGGFTELSLNGQWTVTPQQYVRDVRRYMVEIGNLEWAAIQDWMCEPHMIAKTGLSIEEHQRRTVASALWLRELAPEVPWAPVLQGWTVDDYLRHREMYAAEGVDLAKERIVGVGSVCRRSASHQILELARALSDLPLHGFGVKMRGVEVAARYFASTDSMAWSFGARYRPPLPGCAHAHCNNCLRYALEWRERLLARLAEVARNEPLTEVGMEATG